MTNALSFLQNLHTDVPVSRHSMPLSGSTETSCPASSTCTHELPNCQVGSSETLQQTVLHLDRPSDEFRPHLTLVTKEELAACTVSRSQLLQQFQLLDSTACFPAGIAIAVKAVVPHSVAASHSNTRPIDRVRKLRMRGQESQMLPETWQLEAKMEPSVGKSSQNSLNCFQSSASLAQTGCIRQSSCTSFYDPLEHSG